MRQRLDASKAIQCQMDSIEDVNVNVQKDDKQIQVDPITLLISDPVQLLEPPMHEVSEPQLTNSAQARPENKTLATVRKDAER